MGDSSASRSYIHMVQNLIETCLIFHLTKEECMEALSKHANMDPVITSTVWNELEKVNKEFFQAYAHVRHQSQSRDDGIMSVEEINQMIQRMISQPDHDQSTSKDSDDHQ